MTAFDFRDFFSDLNSKHLSVLMSRVGRAQAPQVVGLAQAPQVKSTPRVKSSLQMIPSASLQPLCFPGVGEPGVIRSIPPPGVIRSIPPPGVIRSIPPGGGFIPRGAYITPSAYTPLIYYISNPSRMSMPSLISYVYGGLKKSLPWSKTKSRPQTYSKRKKSNKNRRMKKKSKR